MLMTITCKGSDAQDLSWLLHKRPDRFQAFNLPYGTAYVFFPEYSDNKCIVTLLLDVESSGLNDICKAKDGEFQYVNPRQYLSGSLLSGAITKVFASAIKGVCEEKPELVDKVFNYEMEITSFSCRLNPDYIEKLFLPLGYEIDFTKPSGQYSEIAQQFGNLKLIARTTLQKLLSQLFILLPVFDRQLHFWIGESQLEKFIRHSTGWLENHPEKSFIINEYFWPASELKYRVLEYFNAIPSADEKAPGLNALRQEEIINSLIRHDATSILDLGCGNGSLLELLAQEKRFSKIAGMDIAARNIDEARKKLCSPGRRLCEAEYVFVGSLTYKDKRISNYDALVLSEVIEHFELERMVLVMKNIFEHAKPRLFIMTTPNKAYNIEYLLKYDEIRHPDHRHEFNEEEFTSFCQKFASQYNYELEMSSIGEKLPELGAPTLMGIFKKCA